MNKLKPVVLLILDGFGIANASPSNAITLAHTPQWDEWTKQGTFLSLNASGAHVGLPDLQMGNSEVGHMHIGAGRVIKQDLSLINDAIESGDFFSNKTLIDALWQAKQQNRRVHLLGLVSDGGVHAHEKHLFALLKLLAKEGMSNALIHCITDGRDSAPKGAANAIRRLQEKLNTYPVGNIASIIGRFYAMDRDERWDRVEKAYDILTTDTRSTLTANKIIDNSYAQQITDEFILPQATKYHEPIKDDDLVICFNFRSDRMRELSKALSDEHFSSFKRRKIKKCHLLTMTTYAEDIKAAVIFPKAHLDNTLGECVSKAKYKQLRLAETEKYAHVTFFFNGGKEQVFVGESRKLIPSPKVATYDLKPEMSADDVTCALIDAISSTHFQLIVCNYANADMVGHTGNITATVKAIETLDKCFQKIKSCLDTHPCELIITADHGNAEQMLDEHSQHKHTAHTSSLVPFLHIGSHSSPLKKTGSLIDIAPTVLSLLKIKIPEVMTGIPLLKISPNEHK